LAEKGIWPKIEFDYGAQIDGETKMDDKIEMDISMIEQDGEFNDTDTKLLLI
jgi:hypothetical protein